MLTFKELGIKKDIIGRLNKNGIKSPTQVQEESIELTLNKKDIIAEAPTGTGKTLAFLLPMMNEMKPNNGGIQGLILSPTRELAIQITEEAEKLNYDNLNIMTIYGGKEYKNQIQEAKGKLDLIIATPGRLLDFIGQGLIKLNNIKTLVLDEADQMLLMGFQNEVESIVNATNKKRQTLCYSATMDKTVKKLAYRITKEPVNIKVEVHEEHKDNMLRYHVPTTDREKLDSLCTILNEENPFMAIIFCRTKVRVEKVEQRLEERGYNVQKLHSDIPQVKREKIIKSFRNAEIQYLVATDVASRGLDITGVTHIFSLDTPEKVDTYVHRVGRTARAGEKGKTYLFTTPKDTKVFEEIEELLGKDLEKIEFTPEKDVNNTNETFAKKYNKKINARSKAKWEDKKTKKK
jgi:superfamily II DNA/RNA helicase